MLTLRNNLLGTVAAGALVAGLAQGAWAAGGATLTLNPTANNNGNGVVCPTCTTGTIATDELSMFWYANMGVQGKAQTNGGQTESYSQSVVFWVNQLDQGNVPSSPSSLQPDNPNTYYIVGTLQINGSGIWKTGSSLGKFKVTTLSSISLNLYGVPGSACANLNTCIGLPGAQNGSNFGITGIPASDMILVATANAGSLTPNSNSANEVTNAGTTTGGVASEVWTLTMNVTPENYAFGNNGFIQSIVPPSITFVLDGGINTTGNGTGAPTWTDPSNQTNFLVSDQAGSLNLDPGPIPEPASISLFGAGLIGLGAMVRRRRNKKA